VTPAAVLILEAEAIRTVPGPPCVKDDTHETRFSSWFNGAQACVNHFECQLPSERRKALPGVGFFTPSRGALKGEAEERLSDANQSEGTIYFRSGWEGF